ncbi:hypothetical protein HDV06_004505 [Boothiomyces sp. JEL0866]|nr:hypothetical protein HDV06_004505 [Boothiomyces sp. JEL0866]
MSVFYKLCVKINEYAIKPCDALYIEIKFENSAYRSELFLISPTVELQSLFIYHPNDSQLQVELLAYHTLLGNSITSVCVAKATFELNDKEPVHLSNSSGQLTGTLSMDYLIIVCDKQEWGDSNVNSVVEGYSNSVKYKTPTSGMDGESIFQLSTQKQFQERLSNCLEIDCKLDFNILSKFQTANEIIEFTLRCDYHPTKTDSDISKDISKTFAVMSVHQIQHQITGYKNQILKDLDSFKSIAQSYLNYQTSKTKTQMLMRKTRATINIIISILKTLEQPTRERFGSKSDEYSLLSQSIDKLDFHYKSSLLYVLQNNTLKNVRLIYQIVLDSIANAEYLVRDFIPREISINQEFVLITRLVSLLTQKSLHIFMFEKKFEHLLVGRQEYVLQTLESLQQFGYLLPIIIPGDLAYRFTNIVQPMALRFHSTLQNDIQYFIKSEKYYISIPSIINSDFEIPIIPLFIVNPINKYDKIERDSEILQKKSMQSISRYSYSMKIPKLEKYSAELVYQQIDRIQKKLGILFGQIVFNSNLEFTEKEVFSINL